MTERVLRLNLQFFADSAGDKTEEATPRKKEKAREDGQVAKSVEITTTFLIVIMFFALKFIGPFIFNRILKIYKIVTNLFGVGFIDENIGINLFKQVFVELIICILPFFAISYFIAFASNAMQVGIKFTFKPLQPKLSNLSPLSGLKRIFSLRTIVELIKSLLKIAIILAIVYFEVRDYDAVFFRFYEMSYMQSYMTMFDLAINIGIKIGIFFIVVAIIDFAYQKYSLAKKLKMTKQEVKDEYKMVEGNPEIKQKIRQRMREASMRRMMQDLESADVVITNPTHFAVAIKYEDGVDIAPVVVAKGVDLIAFNIRQKSQDLEIEIIEDKALARALYYTVEIGEVVPESLYEPVARILALVYSMNRGEGVNA